MTQNTSHAVDHCDGSPIRTAPTDGTEILIRVIHPAARYYKDPVAEGYDAWVKAKWIDHNGGGWTWMGVAGTPVQWRPIPIPPHDAPPPLGE